MGLYEGNGSAAAFRAAQFLFGYHVYSCGAQPLSSTPGQLLGCLCLSLQVLGQRSAWQTRNQAGPQGGIWRGTAEVQDTSLAGGQHSSPIQTCETQPAGSNLPTLPWIHSFLGIKPKLVRVQG